MSRSDEFDSGVERRAVIVTGASSGIGRAIAIRLARAKFDLYLTGRSAEGLETTAKLVAEHGKPAQLESFDIAKRGAVQAYIEKVGKSHPYLFGLINNAGIMHPEPILSGQMDRWRAMMDVNYFAPLEASVAAVAAMRAHGRPAHIVNISSIAADTPTMGPYAASKRALEIVTSTLREELQKDDIRVTILAPGAFATQLARDFTPQMHAKLLASAHSQGFDLSTSQDERVIGSANHLAEAVLYVLSQPTLVNVDRIVIRPPITIAI